VHSRVTRISVLAAATGAVAVLAAGCTSGSSSSGNGASGSTSTGTTTTLTAQQAVDLAATKTTTVNSISATFTLQATTPSGAVNASGSIKEQIHPTVLVEGDFNSFNAGGQSLPGGLGEIITNKAVYLRFATITKALGTSKPWAEIPLTGSPLGSTLSSLLNDVQSNSPVTETQMLDDAPDVHKVGTGTVDGVAVTEYAGSVPFSQAIAKLPANVRATINSSASSTGIKTVNFDIWRDSQQQPRKVVVTETGTSVSETVTENITGFNEPVDITLPSAAETYQVPAGDLNGAS
jgi:hypothetical protein